MTISTTSHRIEGLDGLRGALLLLMTFNHLLLWPYQTFANLYRYAYQPLGFVSAAEGFFLLSGIVSSMAYGRMHDKSGMGKMWQALKTRLFKIYILNLMTALLIVTMTQLSWTQPDWLSFLKTEYTSLGFFAQAMQLVFINTPWLCDILPAYLVFLTLIPPVVFMMNRGLTKYVFLVMTLLWGLGQFYPMAFIGKFLGKIWPGHQFTLGWFELSSWQMMFFAPFILTELFRKNLLPDWLAKTSRVAMVFCSIYLVVFFIQRHFQVPLPEDFIQKWSAVKPLALLRLLNVLCLAYLMYSTWGFWNNFFDNRILKTIGRASLGVFIYHILLVYLNKALLTDASEHYLITTTTSFLISIASIYPVAIFWLWRRRVQKKLFPSKIAG